MMFLELPMPKEVYQLQFVYNIVYSCTETCQVYSLSTSFVKLNCNMISIAGIAWITYIVHS